MKISASAFEAAHSIDRLERLIRAGEQSDGLNPAQWDALRYLGIANRFSRTPAALADYLATTRGTVSRTLASLEEKGAIERIASTRDGRSVDFALTKSGHRLLDGDPLTRIAAGIDRATKADAPVFSTLLASVLRDALARNGGRAFGHCNSCRHFRAGHHAGNAQPHHCALLNESLSDADSKSICAEQEPAAA
jgi:DNA-binding MarR family transcriptional regulator